MRRLGQRTGRARTRILEAAAGHPVRVELQLPAVITHVQVRVNSMSNLTEWENCYFVWLSLDHEDNTWLDNGERIAWYAVTPFRVWPSSVR